MKDFWQVPLAGWPPFGPDLRGRTRFFGLGEVRLALLSLISEGPKHGYQLMKELASRLGSLYRASSGTVYPVLQQLEREGLVVYRLEEGRKMYRLTRPGRKLLATEARAVSDIWSRAEEVEDWGQQVGPHSVAVAGPLTELCSTALRASKWGAGDPDREDQIREILRSASASLNKLMASKQTSTKERQ